MKTPFFPQLRARLAPLSPRVQPLRQQSLLPLDQLFGPLLPPGLLSQADEGPNSRARLYNRRRPFVGFLFQVLNPHCPAAKSSAKSQRSLPSRMIVRWPRPPAAGVRPEPGCLGDILPRLRAAAAAPAERAAQLWRGFCVKVIDGTSPRAPDTPKNPRAYPQSGGQQPGCGFPLLKLVGVFSLATGALLDYAKGNKPQHELALLQKLLDQFKAGDLALADRGFNAYTLRALLLGRGAHSLFRLHQRRPADLRKGKRLGQNDRLMVWRKPWL